MNRFLVISPHTADECKMAIKQFREYNAGFLTHFEWGCLDNDHTAYAIINADTHENAKMSVPPMLRTKAKVIRVTYFNPESSNDPLHNK